MILLVHLQCKACKVALSNFIITKKVGKHVWTLLLIKEDMKWLLTYNNPPTKAKVIYIMMYIQKLHVREKAATDRWLHGPPTSAPGPRATFPFRWRFRWQSTPCIPPIHCPHIPSYKCSSKGGILWINPKAKDPFPLQMKSIWEVQNLPLYQPSLSFMENFSFRGVAMTNEIFSFLPLPFDCEDTLMAHGGVV